MEIIQQQNKGVCMETCANCGREIGNLETPQVFNERIVCRKCWTQLNAEEPANRSALAMPPIQDYMTPQLPQPAYPVQTIQQTSKVWKVQILISALMCIVGVVAFTVGVSDGQPGAMTIWGVGAVLIAIGLIWFIFARIGAWWFHG